MRSAIMGILALLTACSGNSTTKYPEPLAGGERWSAELFLTNRCVLAEAKEAPSPLVAGIAAAFVPALIDVSLSAFSQALQNAAKEKTTAYAGNRAVPLFHRTQTAGNGLDELPTSSLEVDPQFRCVLVLAGRFSSGRDSLGYNNLNFGSSPVPENLETVSIEDLTTYLKNVGIGLAAPPDLIYEAEIHPQPGNQAFVLRSNFLYVGRFQDGGSSAKRALAITVAIDTPLSTTGASTLRAIPITFGEVEAGTRLVRGQFGRGERSVLFSTIPASDAAKSRFELIASVETHYSVARAELKQVMSTKPKTDEEEAARAKKIEELNVRLVDLEERHGTLAAQLNSFMPVEVTATVVETKSVSSMIKFLADVFEGAKAGVAESLKEELDPAKRKAAKEAEEKAAETLEDSLSDTKIAYLQAKGKWLAGGPDELQTEILREEYVKALRAYNRVRADAGLSPLTD